MLIVEGTDLVGKTTLCNKLVIELNKRIGGYQYQHFTRLPEGWDYYWSYVNRMSRRIVQDRFHDSELAYCHGRGETSMFDGTSGSFQYSLVEAKLALLGCLKVVVITSRSELTHRFDGRGDDMYKLDVIEKANDWFAENCHRFHMMWQSDAYPTDEFVQQVADVYVIRQNIIECIRNRHPRHGL